MIEVLDDDAQLMATFEPDYIQAYFSTVYNQYFVSWKYLGAGDLQAWESNLTKLVYS